MSFADGENERDTSTRCSVLTVVAGLRVTEGIFEDSIFNMFTKADYLKDIEKKRVQEKEERRKRIS